MLDSEEEYLEIKQETLNQLKEFQQSLEDIIQNDNLLRNEIDSYRMAVRAACLQAFKTPEIIKMFAEKNSEQCNKKLSELDADFKLGRLSAEEYHNSKTELLVALQKLGVKLDEQQTNFLKQNMSSALKVFIENDQTTLSSLIKK